MSKKRRIKKKKVIQATTVLLGIIIVFALLFAVVFKKDFKVTLTENTINIGEQFTNQFKATWKGKDVTDNVEVDSKIDNTKIGKYKVIFTYKQNNKQYKATKEVKVADKTAPEITLTRGTEIIISKNTTYEEPGYKAIDNCDGDITSKVKVDGKVDTSKEGDYKITYTVSDNSKNKATVERTVKVTTKSPVDMSIKDFSLDGYFEDTILKKTANMGDDYIDDIIFAGDSMPLYYVINKEITGKQLWHRESLNPETALTNTIYVNHQESHLTMPEVFGKYKPKMVILTLGTNSAAYMEVNYFINCYKKLVEEIQKQSPDTVLIIQSIPPVDGSLDDNQDGLTNAKINKFNYYLAEMCHELHIPFLNSAVAMKDENGQCKEGYCLNGSGEHGIHPSTKGTDALIEYTKTHAYQAS